MTGSDIRYRYLRGGGRAGQVPFLEYVTFLAAFCIAIFGIQLYLKRAVAGRAKASADAFGGAFDVLGKGTVSAIADQEQRLKSGQDHAIGVQFSPAWSNVVVQGSSSSRVRQTSLPDGSSKAEDLDVAISQRSGYDDFSDRPLTAEQLYE